MRLLSLGLIGSLLVALGSPVSAAPIAVAAPLAKPVCIIATTAPVICTVPVIVNGATVAQPAQVFLGVANNSLSAQTATVACFDNASAASGQAINIGPLGVTQVVTWPGSGRPVSNGLVCQASGTVNISGPGATGIEVYLR